VSVRGGWEGACDGVMVITLTSPTPTNVRNNSRPRNDAHAPASDRRVGDMRRGGRANGTCVFVVSVSTVCADCLYVHSVTQCARVVSGRAPVAATAAAT
jgi:hypothetical protein